MDLMIHRLQGAKVSELSLGGLSGLHALNVGL